MDALHARAPCSPPPTLFAAGRAGATGDAYTFFNREADKARAHPFLSRQLKLSTGQGKLVGALSYD